MLYVVLLCEIDIVLLFSLYAANVLIKNYFTKLYVVFYGHFLCLI